MQLNSFTDYSLRALIYLVIKNGERSTVSEISSAYSISQNHLVKVVHNLSKLGLVETFKGKGGGIILTKDPSEINIGLVVKKLEQSSSLLECFGEKNTCKLSPECKLKFALNEALKSFYNTLNDYSLADIAKNKSQIRRSLNL